jgi:predicted secreted protein
MTHCYTQATGHKYSIDYVVYEPMHNSAMAYELPQEWQSLYSSPINTTASHTAAYTSIQSISIANLFGRSYAMYYAVDIVQYALGLCISVEKTLLFSKDTVISQGYCTYVDDDCYIAVDEQTGTVSITTVTSNLPMLDSASGTTFATSTASSSPTSATMSSTRSHSSISTQLDVLEPASMMSSSDDSDSDTSSFQSEAEYLRIANNGHNKAASITRRESTKHTATTNSVEEGSASISVTAPKHSIMNSVAYDVSQIESSNGSSNDSNSLLLGRQPIPCHEITALVRLTYTLCHQYYPSYIDMCSAQLHAILRASSCIVAAASANIFNRER